jgi:hypothetical protein
MCRGPISAATKPLFPVPGKFNTFNTFNNFDLFRFCSVDPLG